MWRPEPTASEKAALIADLNAYLDPHKVAARARGETLFMGIPDRWYEALTWRCASGHVTGHVIRSEARGGDVCVVCGLPARLTFPEDTALAQADAAGGGA